MRTPENHPIDVVAHIHPASPWPIALAPWGLASILVIISWIWRR